MKKEERELLMLNLAQDLILKYGECVIREFRFHPIRRWRFDLAMDGPQIALEVEGGAWVQGRHVRGGGYEGDMEKYNEAQLAGWMVLRCTWKQVKNGEAMKLLGRAMILRWQQ